jgi:hypothetical protein
MVSQPGRDWILVAADRDPVDADRGTTMIDECAARVVHVVDMPLDEERETLGHGGVEAYKVPCELDAIGTCTTHQTGPAPGPSGRRLDVLGVQPQRRGSFGDLEQTAPHPTTRAGWKRLRRDHHRHDFDVAAAAARHAGRGTLPPASAWVRTLNEEALPLLLTLASTWPSYTSGLRCKSRRNSGLQPMPWTIGHVLLSDGPQVRVVLGAPL